MQGTVAVLRPFSGEDESPELGTDLPKVIRPKPAFQAQARLGAPALSKVQVGLYLAQPFPLAGCSCPGWGLLGMLHHPHWQAARRCWDRHLHSHAWPTPLGCCPAPAPLTRKRPRGGERELTPSPSELLSIFISLLRFTFTGPE